MRKVWLVPVALLVMAARGWRGQGGDEPLTLRAVRFFSPASATTTIEGVCEVRLGAFAPGSAQTVRYRVEVAVADSTGLQLQNSDWSREVPVALARAVRATAVETFEFRVAPGRYRVSVRAIPETGSAIERTLDVTGFTSRPALSDLLLSTSVRMPGADSAVAAGEIEHGGLVMRTAPVPHLSPTEASLSYYAEVYPWPGASPDGELRVAVLGEGGRSVIRTAPRPVQLGPGGGAARGSVDLAGLPVGDYVLQLAIRLGDSSVAAEAPFSMGAMSSVAAADGPGGTVADPLEDASEGALDSLYAPLVYLLDGGEQGVYDRLAVDGKRRFLREFWAKRDPTHGAGANRAMAQFYRAVGYANERFREGGAGQISGWRTDRGRVFLRNGRWDEILQRPMATPQPYEAWKYTRGRPRYYVFLDRSGLGHYQLIGTNDRREQGMPDWQTLLGSENYTEVAHFLGLSQDQQ